MAILEYSYTTLDRHNGTLRTFRISTGSRNAAFAEIRRKVQDVNVARRAKGITQALELPTLIGLDASEPSFATRSTGVALYA